MELLHKLESTLDIALRDIREAFEKVTVSNPIACMILPPMIGELTTMRNRVSEINNHVAASNEILNLARQNAHPGVNPGAHELASKILVLLGDRGEVR